MSQPLLSVDDVAVRFGAHEVLRGVSCEVHPGEVVALIGPNGAGKTTLFNAISGFVRPSRGSISLNGKALAGLRPGQLFAAGVARTFQEGNLFESMTVRENLFGASGVSRLRDAFGTFFATPSGRRREVAARERARSLADEFNVTRLLDKQASDISTGSRRLVGLGRALAAEPALLLLDEPAAGLSINNRAMLSRIVRAIARNSSRGILLVEHDLDFVSDSADRVYVLHLGEIVAEGTPAEVRRDPGVRAAYMGS
ncbi:ATP-binding cassette domain-containing protein [Micromonospora sp. NBC_01405]|uniref:ABC transporter ATP-binding protein n=1 Tax=Micromonospora sp. NBC_01405 TaxID=2903589 RepID=UPI0032555B28